MSAELQKHLDRMLAAAQSELGDYHDKVRRMAAMRERLIGRFQEIADSEFASESARAEARATIVTLGTADSASPSHAPLIGHCARCGVGLYGGSEGECFTVCTPCYEAERATQTVSEEQR
jgi:hypothetical protein